MEHIGLVRSALSRSAFEELPDILKKTSRGEQRLLLAYIVSSLPASSPSSPLPRLGFQPRENTRSFSTNRLVDAVRTGNVVMGIYDETGVFRDVTTLRAWRGAFHRASLRLAKMLSQQVRISSNVNKWSVPLRAQPRLRAFEQIPVRTSLQLHSKRGGLLRDPMCYAYWGKHWEDVHTRSTGLEVRSFLKCWTQFHNLMAMENPKPSEHRRLPKSWIRVFQEMFGSTYKLALTEMFVEELCKGWMGK